MRVDLNNVINQINTANQCWESISASLSSPENLQNLGVSVADITRSFSQINGMLQGIKEEDIDGVAWTQHKTQIDAQSQAISNFFNTHAGNSSQILAGTSNICSWLWSLKNSLRVLLPIHQEANTFSDGFLASISEKITTFEYFFSKAEETNSQIHQTQQLASQTAQQIDVQKTAADGALNTIQATLMTIQGVERESGTAKVNAERAATDATSKATAVAKLAEDLTESVNLKNALFKEFKDIRNEIYGLLENANKVGLAKSFQDQRKRLLGFSQLIGIAFFFAIITFAAAEFYLLSPLIVTGKFDPIAFVLRFLLSSPIIWLCWFLVRYYGYAVRMAEDYAFKEAAAMAFAGYRNEVSADSELLKLLQESAIKNFGANPSKLLLKKADASSPIHEAIDKLLEKMKPEDMLSALSKHTEQTK